MSDSVPGAEREPHVEVIELSAQQAAVVGVHEERVADRRTVTEQLHRVRLPEEPAVLRCGPRPDLHAELVALAQ